MNVLGMTFSLSQVIAAVVAASPAIIAAYHARKGQKNTDTKNGKKLGEMVEGLRAEFRAGLHELNERLSNVEEKVK